MNKYQFKAPTSTGLGTSYYYCYGDNSFENYLNLKNIKYKKLTDDGRSGRNLFNKKDKEIERLNNIIKEQGLEDKSNYYVKGLEGSLKEYQDEVKRLNNIINEFDKWLDEESEKTILSTGHLTCLMMCKNKLQKLKGSDKK